jgi:hypothetical protein
LLKLVGLSNGSDFTRDEYDPVYGLPRRAVDEWVARNPTLKTEYAAVLRARARSATARARDTRDSSAEDERLREPIPP